MPIRPENKDRYPKDWDQISNRIRERAGWKCQWCGVPNGELGGRDRNGTWLPAHPKGDNGLHLQWPEPGDHFWCGRGEVVLLRIVRIVLTVAHLDHRPENCADDNLRALCQRCHNVYDADARRAGINQRKRAGAAIGDLF